MDKGESKDSKFSSKKKREILSVIVPIFSGKSIELPLERIYLALLSVRYSYIAIKYLKSHKRLESDNLERSALKNV